MEYSSAAPTGTPIVTVTSTHTATPTPTPTSTATRTSTPAPTHTLGAARNIDLPTMLKGDHGPSLVENGGLENGDLSGWQQGGELSRAAVTDVTHRGRYAALLGNPEVPACQARVGQAWIEQELSISAGGTVTLALWLRLFSYDLNPDLDDGIDYLEVAVNERPVLRVANRNSTQY